MQQFFSKAMTFGPRILTPMNPLPTGEIAALYAPVTLAATGGSPPYTWGFISGGIVAGLTLSPGGVVSGTPTTVGSSFGQVQVTDSQGATSNAVPCSLTTITAVTVFTSFLPAATQGTPYSTTLVPGPGAPPYLWSLASGTLPAGLSLSSGGVISGTPTNVETDTPVIQVTDIFGGVAQRSFSLMVSAPSTAKPLGFNTTNLTYYEPPQPFINLFHSGGQSANNLLIPGAQGGGSVASGWITQNGSGTGTKEEGALQLDSDGYVTSMTASPVPFGGQKFTQLVCFLKLSINNGNLPPGASFLYPPGSYTLQGQGAGTIAISGDASAWSGNGSTVTVNGSNAFVSTSTSGTWSVTFTANAALNPTACNLQVKITANDPLVTGNYLKALVCCETALLASYNGGTRYHPRYLTMAQGFTGVRFMKELNTENSENEIFLVTGPGASATSATLQAGFIGASLSAGVLTVVSGVSFTGSQTGSVLTVTAIGTGPVMVGLLYSGSGVPSTSIITGQLTGSAGGTGTYSINNATTLGSQTFTQNSPIDSYHDTSAVNYLRPGMQYTGPGISAGATINSQLSGTTGGAGTYAVSNNTDSVPVAIGMTVLGNWYGYHNQVNKVVFSNGNIRLVTFQYESNQITWSTPLTAAATGNVYLAPYSINWARRSLPTNCFYSTANGAPFELCFQLCNLLGADAHMNLNISQLVNESGFTATDFLSQFNALALATLNVLLRCSIEPANETWNSNYDSTAMLYFVGLGMFPTHGPVTNFQLNRNAYGRICALVAQQSRIDWGGQFSRCYPMMGGQWVQAITLQNSMDTAYWFADSGQRASDFANYPIKVATVAPYYGLTFPPINQMCWLGLQADLGLSAYFAMKTSNAFTVNFTGSVSGGVLTVTAVTAPGGLVPSQPYAGVGITAGAIINSQLTGQPGKTGTYAVSNGSDSTGSIALLQTITIPGQNSRGWVVHSQDSLAGYLAVVGPGKTYPNMVLQAYEGGFGAVDGTTAAKVNFTASQSGTTLTVSAVTSPGIICPGYVFAGTGITVGSTINSQISGTPGGVGTYAVSNSQTIASEAMTQAVWHDLSLNAMRDTRMQTTLFDFQNWWSTNTSYTRDNMFYYFMLCEDNSASNGYGAAENFMQSFTFPGPNKWQGLQNFINQP